MPENSAEEMQDGQVQETATPPVETKAETKKQQFERQRLSRRQALRKLGMTTAMATFAMFSVDDLARMVGKVMQQQAGDNQVAEQVARELNEAGVAMAGGNSFSFSGSSSSPTCNQDYCTCMTNCGNNDQTCINNCVKTHPPTPQPCVCPSTPPTLN